MRLTENVGTVLVLLYGTPYSTHCAVDIVELFARAIPLD